MDRNYAAGFEDFRMDAIENFPEVDFSFIKLNLAATSSLCSNWLRGHQY